MDKTERIREDCRVLMAGEDGSTKAGYIAFTHALFMHPKRILGWKLWLLPPLTSSKATKRFSGIALPNSGILVATLSLKSVRA